MSTKLSAVISLTTLGCVLLSSGGCPLTLDRGLTGAGGGATLTLTHAGVDFSTGTAGDIVTGDVANSDGDMIGWAPSPNNWVSSDTEVWFRPGPNTATENFISDMGAVALSSVTTIPTTWDGGSGQDLPALQVDHVYVVKCEDGYAKFLVKATRVTPDWEADVEYVYTTGTTFAN